MENPLSVLVPLPVRATCSVTCALIQSPNSRFRAGNHVHSPFHVACSLFVSCTVRLIFSHDLPQSTTQSQDQTRDRRQNVSTSRRIATNPKSSHFLCRLAYNGSTCYAPQTPAIQYNLQQTARREDTRRKARLSSHRKTCHRSQVR